VIDAWRMRAPEALAAEFGGFTGMSGIEPGGG
jgi:hypothetical protein